MFKINQEREDILDRKERERENRRVITKLYIYIFFFEKMEGFEVTVCLGDVSTLAIVGK